MPTGLLTQREVDKLMNAAHNMDKAMKVFEELREKCCTSVEEICDECPLAFDGFSCKVMTMMCSYSECNMIPNIMNVYDKRKVTRHPKQKEITSYGTQNFKRYG